MSSSRPRVLVVGCLPPPFIGPYLALRRLLECDAIRESVEVEFLDISDHRDTSSIGAFDLRNAWLGVVHALKCIRLLVVRRPRVLYVGISQGRWGFLRDLCFLVPALLLRRRVVIHLRGSEFDQFYRTMGGLMRWVTRATCRRVRICIVLGESLRRVMSALVPPERIRAVPNGLDWRPFAASRTVGSRGRRVLFLSHLMKRKGIFEALEAFALVREEFPDATLTLAGAWQNSEDQASLEARIRDLGMGSAVRFTGVVQGETKLSTYGEHDIFLFPPIQPEGLPWVILEAMAAGLPVVTTDQGAIREVVLDGETGFVSSAEPAALAVPLLRLLRSPEAAEDMGRRGQKRVAECFSEDVYHRAIAALLVEAAGKP